METPDESGLIADVGVMERELVAIRASASFLRHMSQMLPPESSIGAEMLRWSIELSLAAEERGPAGGARLQALRAV